MQENILYGKRPILECIKAGRRRIKKLYLLDTMRDPEMREARVEVEAQGKVQEVGQKFFERNFDDLLHQGCVAEVETYPYISDDEMDHCMEQPGPALWIALDQIQDPQNVGSLIRSGVGLGVDGFIMLRHRSCLVTPSVVKASSGAVEHAKIYKAGNLAQLIEQLKQASFVSYGLDMDGDKTLPEVQFAEKSLLILGAEGHGLRDLTKKTCDVLLRIPQSQDIASLNVGVAGALAIYCALQQKQIK